MSTLPTARAQRVIVCVCVFFQLLKLLPAKSLVCLAFWRLLVAKIHEKCGPAAAAIAVPGGLYTRNLVPPPSWMVEGWRVWVWRAPQALSPGEVGGVEFWGGLE